MKFFTKPRMIWFFEMIWTRNRCSLVYNLLANTIKGQSSNQLSVIGKNMSSGGFLSAIYWQTVFKVNKIIMKTFSKFHLEWALNCMVRPSYINGNKHNLAVLRSFRLKGYNGQHLYVCVL